jgi:hypothetical protein
MYYLFTNGISLTQIFILFYIIYNINNIKLHHVQVPIVSIGYKQTTGHFPDFTDKSDLAILGAEVVAFANVARFALPLRIGLAITTIPWVQENVVDRFWPETEKTE